MKADLPAMDDIDHDRDADGVPADPAGTLAWAFGQMAARWARERQAPDDAVEAVRGAAVQVSLATSAGHVCTPLAALADVGTTAGAADRRTPRKGAPPPTTTARATALRQALLASGVVGAPQARCAAPMILDADGRLYLHRYFDLEARLALALSMRTGPSGNDAAAVSAEADRDAANEAALQALIAQHFPPPSVPGRIDWPRVATAMALTQRLTVVSGGPGTGKTTAVVKLLACLLAQQPGCRIALAAPTGKAAARMLEALRERAAGAALPDSVRTALPTQSYTLHRLLGLGRRRAHAAETLLPYDVLIVDEASMLDLALATRLLEALPPRSRLVLLGDKDQLAAVEAGAVFAELSAARGLSAAAARRLGTLCGIAPAALQAATSGDGGSNGNDDAAGQSPDDPDDEAAGLTAPVRPVAMAPDSVVWFTEQFRFAADSGIGQLATAVRSGSAQTALGLLRRGASGVHWADDGAPAPGEPTLAGIAQGYAGFLSALALYRPLADGAREGDRIATVMAAFDRFRVLCAVREGPRGVDAVNRWMTQHLRRAIANGGGHASDIGSPWFPGRPVMIRRNDALLGVFNGDIGLCLPDRHGALQVWFPDREAGTAQGRESSTFRPTVRSSVRSIAPVRLPPHDTAFAITVHQSQGSEFDDVLLLLPDQPGRAVARELLYTAITRARQAVTLAGPAAVLAQAIETPTRRRSGLAARCAETATLSLRAPDSASAP